MRINADELLNNVKCDAIAKFDTDFEVQSVLDAIATVVRMSSIARKEGLLALEEFVTNGTEDTTDVSSLALLVVDGTDPDLVAEAATNGYWANKYEGNEALKQYILMRGILMIQSGENPRIIEQILKTLLPKSLHSTCDEYVEIKKAGWQEEIDEKTIEQYKKWKQVELEPGEAKDAVQQLEQLILSLDDNALQRALRDIETYDLVECLVVFSDVGRYKVLKNVSSRFSLMLMKDIMRAACFLNDAYIVSAAQKINNVIERLEATGEIVIWSRI